MAGIAPQRFHRSQIKALHIQQDSKHPSSSRSTMAPVIPPNPKLPVIFSCLHLCLEKFCCGQGSTAGAGLKRKAVLQKAPKRR